MKTIALLLSLAISCSAFSQDNKKYEDAMKRNLVMMDTAMAASTQQLLTNSFERIANAEKNKWLPYYYAAYTATRMIYVMDDKTQVDAVLDKAQGFIDKADSLSPDNSEIYAVKGFVLSGRIMVNPMTRGAQYGPQSGAMLEKAIQLNPENPRPYLLKGTSAFFTPPAFGGGKDKAAVLLQTSLDKYKTFKPADAISPNWGEKRAESLLEQCK